MINEENSKDAIESLIESLGQLPETTLEQVSEFIREFNAKPSDKISSDDVSALIERIAYAYFAFPLTLGSGTKLFRGRGVKPGNQPWAHVHSVHYPQEPNDSYLARANFAGQQVLYVGDSAETIFAECRKDRGDKLVLGHLEVQKDEQIRFIVVGDIDRLRRYGQTHLRNSQYEQSIQTVLAALPLKTAMAVRLVDAFFADRFSRKGSEEVYRVTSAIARELMTVGADFLDAIAFGSVEHAGSMNWAVKPSSADAKFTYLRFEGIQLLQAYGYGMYEGGIYARSPAPDADGNIHWEYPT